MPASQAVAQFTTVHVYILPAYPVTAFLSFSTPQCHNDEMNFYEFPKARGNKYTVSHKTNNIMEVNVTERLCLDLNASE